MSRLVTQIFLWMSFLPLFSTTLLYRYSPIIKYWSIYLAIHLSIYLSIYLPISPPPLTRWRLLPIYLSAYLSSSYQVREEGEGQEVGRNVFPHGYYLSTYLPISPPLTRWRKRKRGRKLAGMFPRMATAASASRPLPSCGDNRLSQDLTFILYVTFKKVRVKDSF